MPTITLTVPGEPIAQPRQRHRIAGKGPSQYVHNYTPATHDVQGYKRAIQLLARSQMSGEPWTGPIRVELTLFFKRPASMTWKTKPMPRTPKTSKPDFDNVVKAINDCLNGVVWVDDSQIVQAYVEKWYAGGGESPRTEIMIQTLS